MPVAFLPSMRFGPSLFTTRWISPWSRIPSTVIRLETAQRAWSMALTARWKFKFNIKLPGRVSPIGFRLRRDRINSFCGLINPSRRCLTDLTSCHRSSKFKASEFGGCEVHSITDQLDLPIETIGVARTGLNAHKRPVAIRGRSALLHRLVREPLFHFLVAGTVLLGVATLFERLTNANNNPNRIQVSAPEIQRLREVWMRQWGRAPDSRQMQSLIDDYVREEGLYREALASGLDKDDTIVRRRLVEKMEFLSQELASAAPSENSLQEYFGANREKFRIPGEVAF